MRLSLGVCLYVIYMEDILFFHFVTCYYFCFFVCECSLFCLSSVQNRTENTNIIKNKKTVNPKHKWYRLYDLKAE